MKSVDKTSLMYGVEECTGLRNLLLLQTQLLSLHKYFKQFSGELFSSSTCVLFESY